MVSGHERFWSHPSDRALSRTAAATRWSISRWIQALHRRLLDICEVNRQQVGHAVPRPNNSNVVHRASQRQSRTGDRPTPCISGIELSVRSRGRYVSRATHSRLGEVRVSVSLARPGTQSSLRQVCFG